MSLEYLSQKYIRKNAIELRDYQVNLANQAKSENCIIVLPTGLGKTAIALQIIANYLEKGTGGVLFLAPTRVLANQHFEFLKNSLTLEDIALITGEDPIPKRQKLGLLRPHTGCREGRSVTYPQGCKRIFKTHGEVVHCSTGY